MYESIFILYCYSYFVKHKSYNIFHISLMCRTKLIFIHSNWSVLLEDHISLSKKCQTCNISASNLKPKIIFVSSCSCYFPIHWSQVLNWEWRCSWKRSNHICWSTILLPTKLPLILEVLQYEFVNVVSYSCFLIGYICWITWHGYDGYVLITLCCVIGGGIWPITWSL